MCVGLYIYKKEVENKEGYYDTMTRMSKKTSLRQLIKDYVYTYPQASRKEVKKAFKDCPKDTVDRYYTEFRRTSNNIQIDIRTELQKIIKDYKQPASARVQAIREYNNLIKEEPDKTGDDPYLKFLESKNLKIATTIDSSSRQ